MAAYFQVFTRRDVSTFSEMRPLRRNPKEMIYCYLYLIFYASFWSPYFRLWNPAAAISEETPHYALEVDKVEEKKGGGVAYR